MDQPSVSIIIRCKGRIKHLQQSIAQFALQDYRRSEIILVNYNSPDGLHEWLLYNCASLLKTRKLIEVIVPNILYFEHCHAWNVGLRAAQGDWILFANIDDMPDIRLISYLISRVGKMTNVFATPAPSKVFIPGRILFARQADLIKIGGCMEQFESWGYDLEDLAERLSSQGIDEYRFNPFYISGNLQHPDVDSCKYFRPPYNKANQHQNWKHVSKELNKQRAEAYTSKYDIVANININWGDGGIIFQPDNIDKRWIHYMDHYMKEAEKSNDSFMFKFNHDTGDLLNELELINMGCKPYIIKKVKERMLKKRQGIIDQSTMILKPGDNTIKITDELVDRIKELPDVIPINQIPKE